ncbi:NAD(P)-binding domain-containing protein [Xylophilus sp. GW821-FHT01B05]
MRIGYVGLGAMGGALARRVLRAHPLVVWDINAGAVAALEAHGAAIAPSAQALGRECDVVMLCLPRTSDVHDLLFGTAKLAEVLAPGTLVIDQTTGLPGETREVALKLAARGLRFLEAPVSGGVPAADAGTIAIVICGSVDDQRAALPLLSCISPNILACGERVGDAQATKLVNNLLNAGYRLATLEIAALGRKMGLPLAMVVETLQQGLACNSTSARVLPFLLSGDRLPFRAAISLLLKDTDQAIQLAADTGVPTPLAGIARGLLQMAANMLGPATQVEQLPAVMASLAGTSFAASEINEAPDGAGQIQKARLLNNALAVFNAALSCEAATLAVSLKLDLAAVAQMVHMGSGWSAAADLILPALSQGKTCAELPLPSTQFDLRELVGLSIAHGVPMLLTSSLACMLDIACRSYPSASGVSALSSWYATTSGLADAKP